MSFGSIVDSFAYDFHADQFGGYCDPVQPVKNISNYPTANADKAHFYLIRGIVQFGKKVNYQNGSGPSKCPGCDGARLCSSGPVALHQVSRGSPYRSRAEKLTRDGHLPILHYFAHPGCVLQNALCATTARANGLSLVMIKSRVSGDGTRTLNPAPLFAFPVCEHAAKGSTQASIIFLVNERINVVPSLEGLDRFFKRRGLSD
jgi:hypothetical protein